MLLLRPLLWYYDLDTLRGREEEWDRRHKLNVLAPCWGSLMAERQKLLKGGGVRRNCIAVRLIRRG
jgi:hypothetical protein